MTADENAAAVILEFRAKKAKKPLITKRQLKDLGEGAAIGAVAGLAFVGTVTIILMYAGKIEFK
jgi:hypothetical protein